ncbi:MAG: aldolase/citrate lyase family protein, partial [Alphaproteobacteria bacterium]|nr:aldolase/citrate lyase family protein [Alphaproteobacteria bacterium]
MNNLKSRIQSGNVAKGVFVGIESPQITKVMAQSGMDFVFIDQQHGLIAPDALDHMITPLMVPVSSSDSSQSANVSCVPIVRVATNDPGLIMGALDRGALGIVCPLVNTGEEARRFIHAMRYPPK